MEGENLRGILTQAFFEINLGKRAKRK